MTNGSSKRFAQTAAWLIQGSTWGCCITSARDQAANASPRSPTGLSTTRPSPCSPRTAAHQSIQAGTTTLSRTRTSKRRSEPKRSWLEPASPHRRNGPNYWAVSPLRPPQSPPRSTAPLARSRSSSSSSVQPTPDAGVILMHRFAGRRPSNRRHDATDPLTHHPLAGVSRIRL